MGVLYIEEYSGLGDMNVATSPFRRANGEIAQQPSLRSQTVTYSTSTASVAFGAGTYLVRLHTDSICSYQFGLTSPTATTSTPRMAANQTEYFAVQPGMFVAAITNT
jgi:hypothetical protein